MILPTALNNALLAECGSTSVLVPQDLIDISNAVWSFATRGLTEEVTTDSASREASKADVSGLATSVEIAALNDFDPANDLVAHVALVDVTTTNTDMRGTDNVPTNPVLDTDPRLDALDAPISTRSTFDPDNDTVTTDAASRKASRAKATISL